MNNHRATAQAILDKIIYATIATSEADGTPWAAPQFIAYNKDSKAIYWCAARHSQHAQNISNNHKAYIVVYDSSVGPGEGSGVYIRTVAHEITNLLEAKKAMTELIERHQGIPYWTFEDTQASDSSVAVFKAKIQCAWVNEGHEEDGHFILYREPVEL